MKEGPAYQRGKKYIKTAILLSTPGAAEKEANRPAAGKTGQRLGRLVKEAHRRDPEIFPSSNYREYPIINSVEAIHYRAATGRSEGTHREVYAPKNAARLKERFDGLETVYALGALPRHAVKAGEFGGQVLYGPHPSDQHLRTTYRSDAGTPSERERDREAQYFERALADLDALNRDR